MTVCAISDTHNQHDRLQLEPTDFLLHAGDFTGRGTEPEVRAFLKWFAEQPHRHKIFIGGNHDFLLEKYPVLFRKWLPANIIYLEDEAVDIEGIRIWGSPITPWFHDWAFNRQRGAEIRSYWEEIPEETDILLTHGPPFGFGDRTTRGARVGCQDLLDLIKLRKPRYHIFGHIHEHYGQWEGNGTTFINASFLNELYLPAHEPVYFEIFRKLKSSR